MDFWVPILRHVEPSLAEEAKLFLKLLQLCHDLATFYLLGLSAYSLATPGAHCMPSIKEVRVHEFKAIPVRRLG